MNPAYPNALRGIGLMVLAVSTFTCLDTTSKYLAQHYPVPGIVFVRYMPTHYIHESLVANDPDLASARLWIVFDRGAENQKLIALAPERTTYLFDEKTRAITRLGRSVARR